MSEIPADLKYAKSHEWLRIEGGIGTVGITDHAQHELTDIVFVELPEVGKVLSANSDCAVVESVKSASEIIAPASGEVVEVNKGLEENPALAIDEPYTSGWFFKMKLEGEPEGLLDAAAYATEIGES